MDSLLVINFQKCSIHDGPGIRSTIFFKGCPLDCIWCHNPESKKFTKEVLYNQERCSVCGTCAQICPSNAISTQWDRVDLDRDTCTTCGNCLDYCVNNAREIVGKEYSVKQLVNEIEKDRIFYEESDGGVTLSGGEVMCQDIKFISELAKICKNRGIHIAVDTCGYAKFEHYEEILEFVDLFLYDIKLIDEEKHIKFTGKSNKLILENLKNLSEKGANINIRIPLIEGVNVDEENIEVNKIIEFIKPLNIHKVNLLPYHSIGKHKYEKLNEIYKAEDFKTPNTNKLDEIRKIFEVNNFTTKIGG